MRITVFLLTFLSFLSDLWAVDIPINITGTIIIPPCQINNSNPVDVDFGNIRVSELDTKEHIKVVSFGLLSISSGRGICKDDWTEYDRER